MSARNVSEARFELRHLRHLVAVHERGTLQGAAEVLHLSQSALTKSIQRLEETLGAPLFERSGRRLALSPLGQLVLERSLPILRAADDVQREVELHSGGELGRVVVGVGPVVALGRLPDVLARYCARYPDVDVVVRSGSTEDLVPRLIDGELDLVVADYEQEQPHPDVDVASLGRDPIRVAARPDHPLHRRPTPPTMKEALSFPRGAATAPPRIRQWIRANLPQVDLRVGLTCDNYEVLVSTAERTDMLVLGPSSILTRYEAAGRIALLPISYPTPPSEPAVLSVRDRPRAAAVQAFIAAFMASTSQPAQETT
jgi:DNA-binding transcriptional LysR family regulator